MLHLDKTTLPYLQNKNLLAFSAGVDSTALFFLLLQNKIDFDMALVNYQTRSSSDEEERYAKELALKYQKKCYTIKAPKIEQNFEKNARDFRYHFFEEMIDEYRYDNLITAHQLNDQLEWFLMRLAKGAGLMELIGLQAIAQRPNYTLIHPILHHTKEELLTFLDNHHYHYFVDETNFDNQFERNYFRSRFANKLLEQFPNGIRESFKYLKQDKAILDSTFEEIFRYRELIIVEYSHPDIIAKAVDMTLKSLGYLMSAAQRDEVLKESSSVIGGIWAIERQNNKIYIAPYKQINMPKHYKELCRVHQIPVKIRPYCYEQSILPNVIKL
ncbi:MAG: tRNA lysidine(34) synthetase TilS [Campylobacterales bacterium]|nr:tRNA lysidine(34) synthetase TilS [Campylobacterales bacterium]